MFFSKVTNESLQIIIFPPLSADATIKIKQIISQNEDNMKQNKKSNPGKYKVNFDLT